MTKTRILSTTAMIGPALENLSLTHAPLKVAPFRSAEWNAALGEAEALIVLLSQPLTEEDLKNAPKLKVIGTYSVGVNHLPLKACEARGIQVVNTPGVLTEATADIALALLMALARRIPEGEELVRSGQWKGWDPGQLLGFGFEGKVCGIVGSGPIGRAFARRVWSLGMKPVFWDREGKGGTVGYGAYGAELLAPRMPLEQLLKQAHVLSLHCPLTEQTKGLLGREKLRLLPKGALLINTARGGVVDEEALMDLIDSGELGGAGLDVYENEPKVNPRWFKMKKAVLAPHLGSATYETRSAMAALVCDGISKILAG